MKKLIVSLMAGAIALSLCACGESKDNENTTESKADTAVSVEEVKNVPFSYEIFDGKIKVEGAMPEGFKLVKWSEQVEAKATAESAGEEFTPDYTFINEGYNAIVGPDFAIEMSTESYVYHTSVDYKNEHGETEPNFAAYKEFRKTDSYASKYYPLLKEDMKISDRDALAFSKNHNPEIEISLDDYSTPITFTASVYQNEGSQLESDEAAIDFIDNNKDLKVILDNLKITVVNN